MRLCGQGVRNPVPQLRRRSDFGDFRRQGRKALRPVRHKPGKGGLARDALLRGGTLRPGAWGDVTLLDPDLRWTFDASSSKSKSRNTPFDGWTFRGAAVATVVGGRVVYVREGREATAAG